MITKKAILKAAIVLSVIVIGGCGDDVEDKPNDGQAESSYASDKKLLEKVVTAAWEIRRLNQAEYFAMSDVIELDGQILSDPKSERSQLLLTGITHKTSSKKKGLTSPLSIPAGQRVEVIGGVATLIATFISNDDTGHKHQVMLQFFYANNQFRMDFTTLPRSKHTHHDNGGGTGR